MFGSSEIAKIRQLGVRRALGRAWTTSRSLGLRCELASLPPRRDAKIPLTMVAAHSAAEAGLLAERDAAEGSARLDATERIELCDAGVRRLYVARGEDGQAYYAQWLIEPQDHHLIDAVHPGLFPRPADGDVLLEGAYAYTKSRRLGAMGDGMHQLLQIARDEGNSGAVTYVAEQYLPSMRGCANVGFELDHLRISRRRLFLRRISFVPADDAAREAWAQATAPRPKSQSPAVS